MAVRILAAVNNCAGSVSDPLAQEGICLMDQSPAELLCADLAYFRICAA